MRNIITSKDKIDIVFPYANVSIHVYLTFQNKGCYSRWDDELFVFSEQWESTWCPAISFTLKVIFLIAEMIVNYVSNESC
jgi:hypothetical protein